MLERKRAACPPVTFVLQIYHKQPMFGFKRNKETERYYLLPGQGGEAYRRKQRYLLKWSFVVGLLVATVLGGLMYWLNRPRF